MYYRYNKRILDVIGSPVLTAKGSTITLNWTAPFTLDISGVDPDITYCVDVVNFTSSATLHSECGINRTEFTYLVVSTNAGCDIIQFIVNPINIVGNGTTSTISYFGAEYRKLIAKCNIMTSGNFFCRP